MKEKKIALIVDDFEIVNVKHKEAILNATFTEIDKLIFIINQSEDKRKYCTISELRITIGEILKEIDIEYEIIQLEDKDEIKVQSEKIMNENKVIYVYDKYNMKNSEFGEINKLSENIKTNLYIEENYSKIAKEFTWWINKKVVFSGVESSGKTQMSIKLSKLYNTVYSPEYGRTYAQKHLGFDDEAFTPKDFVIIAQNQIMQDKKMNRLANKFIVVDTDPFVTLRFLNSYYEEYERRKILTKEFIETYENAKNTLEIICKEYKADIIYLLKPNNEYVKDGIRWNNQTQEQREERFNELKEIYEKFDQNYIIVDEKTYKGKFNMVIESVNKLLK